MTPDTIAAIATASGRGGIGVIRISGPLALDLVPHFFGTTPKGPSPDLALTSHTMVHGYIFELESNRMIDEVFLVAMKAPRSYTAEDVVEIQAHAGSLVMGTILNQVITAGARIAEPGEFTKRAFLNGRIDLTQAEAVADIIDAKTTSALKIAAAQGTGVLKDAIHSSRQELIDLLSLLEAAIDFPDELEELIPQELGLERVQRVKAACRRYIQTYEEAHFLRDGVKLAICGPPNVGKSSLMNQFLEKERSIVTEYPGTTRDLIEEPLNINGITFLVSDTAGMHQTDDLVEKIGIERAKKHIAGSDIVLFMKDATRKISESELKGILPRDKKIILVINKIDLVEGNEAIKKGKYQNDENLPPSLAALPQVRISALKNLGIDNLRKTITSLTMEDMGETCSVVPNLRHRKALERAMESLETAEAGFLNLQDEETLAMDIRLAADLLGEITGDTAGIDILDTIFSKFCLGK